MDKVLEFEGELQKFRDKHLPAILAKLVGTSNADEAGKLAKKYVATNFVDHLGKKFDRDHDDITIEEAKALCPPHANLSKDMQNLRWQVFIDGTSKSKAFFKYGGYMGALMEIFKWVWMQHVVPLGMWVQDTPVAGLFEKRSTNLKKDKIYHDQQLYLLRD